MTIDAHALSRRTVLAGLGVGSATLLASRLASAAQEATPALTELPRAGHPLNGVWHWNADIFNELANDLHIMFYPYGLCLEFDPTGGVGLGFWRATGEREAYVSTQYQQLGGTWNHLAGPVETLDVEHIPAPWTYQADILRVNYVVTINPDGERLNASGTFSVFQGVARENVYNQGHHRSATRVA